MPQTPQRPRFSDPAQWLTQQEPPPTALSPQPTSSPLKQLTTFAREQGLTVTSTTGGKHNPGSKHYAGEAIDVRTKDKSPEQINEAMQQATALGYRVIDERQRPAGQRVWGGPHLHLEHTPEVEQFGKFSDPGDWLGKQESSQQFSDPDQWLQQQSNADTPKVIDLRDGESSVEGLNQGRVTPTGEFILQAPEAKAADGAGEGKRLADNENTIGAATHGKLVEQGKAPQLSSQALAHPGVREYTISIPGQAEQLPTEQDVVTHLRRTLQAPDDYNLRSMQTFTPEYLQALQQAGHLRFEPEAGQWQWDIRVPEEVIARIANVKAEKPAEATDDLSWRQLGNLLAGSLAQESPDLIAGLEGGGALLAKTASNVGKLATLQNPQTAPETGLDQFAQSLSADAQTVRQLDPSVLGQLKRGLLTGAVTMPMINELAVAGGMPAVLAHGVVSRSHLSQEEQLKGLITDIGTMQAMKAAGTLPGVVQAGIGGGMQVLGGVATGQVKSGQDAIAEFLQGTAMSPAVKQKRNEPLTWLGSLSPNEQPVRPIIDADHVLALMDDPQIKDASDAVDQARATIAELQAQQAKNQQQQQVGNMPPYKDVDAQLQKAVAAHQEAIAGLTTAMKAKLLTPQSDASRAPLPVEAPSPTVTETTSPTMEPPTAKPNATAKPTAESLLARLQELRDTGIVPESEAASSNAARATEPPAETLRPSVRDAESSSLGKAVESESPATGVLETSARDARQRLTGALRGEQANDITQVVGDLSVLAIHHIYQGGKAFKGWATEMVNEFGTKVRRALRPAWQQAQEFWRDERGELDESALARAILSGGKWASERLGGEKLRDRIYTTNAYAEKVSLPADFDVKKWAQAAHDAARNTTLDDATVKHADRLMDQAMQAIQQRDGGRFAEINEKLNQVLRPRGLKIVSAIGDAQRTASASGEFSFLFRQGRKLLLMEPKSWAKSVPEVIKSSMPYRTKDADGKKTGRFLFNDAAKQRYFNSLATIKADPKWAVAERAGLDVAAIGETESTSSALTHEENTSTGIARQIPILKQTERGNKAFMAKLAFTAFKSRVERLGLDQVTAADIENRTPDGMKVKRLAKDLNVLSGRGDIKEKQRAFFNLASPVGFAPRWAFSNFQTIARYNPLQLARYFGASPEKHATLGKLNPQRLLPVRDAVSMQRANDAAKMALYHLGIVAAMGGLTKSGVPVSVEWEDPDSPDFMKLKVGKQRYDLGMVGNTLRYVLRMAKRGLETREQGWEPVGKALQQTGQFARQKESPLASLVHDQMIERAVGRPETDVDTGEKVRVGRNAIGEIKTFGESVMERAYPLTWQQFVKAIKEGQTEDLIPSLAEAIGEGAQSYENRMEKISPNTKTWLTRDYSGTKGYEPQARFEQRVQRAQTLYQTYFPRLQNSHQYQEADAAQRLKLETALTEKIKEASYQDGATINLKTLLENAARGEKATATRKKKKDAQQPLHTW